jgi:hypothetical protein
MRFRPKLSYANVMATIAVFIALGGASYAALKLPKNSVGAKQLKKNAVTTAKIKKEAITAAKVKSGTLTGTQINASTLGKVPAASNADAVGGVGLSGLLQSDHILTGTADELTAGNLVLRDDRTGLEVRTGKPGRMELVNTNSAERIEGQGVGYWLGAPLPTGIGILPGKSMEIFYESASLLYGQYILTREPGNVSLLLTCQGHETPTPEALLSCVAVG